MSTPTDTSVLRSVVVNIPPETAYTLFTRDFGAIKPVEHNLLSVPITETVFEAHVGGHIYDRGTDGSECRWARVLVVEPPHRVVFSWDIGPSWELENNPENASEVEVRFTAEDGGRTLVELEHRNLDRHGPGWDAARAALESDGGWPLYLQRFAALVAERG